MFFAVIALAASLSHTTVEAQLTAVAQEMAVQAGLPHRITVRVPSEWQAGGVVNAKIYPDGTRATIYISPILVDEMDSLSIRAVLAHELGHTQSTCGLGIPRYATEAGYLACEGKADAFAARLVGRRAVLKSLCEFTYIAFDWRYTTDASSLFARIRKLHYRTDIP